MSAILVILTVFMAAIVGALIYLMIAMMRRMVLRNNAVINLQEIVSFPHHRCPRCGAQMKQGFAASSSGIIWHARNQNAGIPSSIFNSLPNTMNVGMKPRENMAWHCDACASLLVDFSRIVRT